MEWTNPLIHVAGGIAIIGAAVAILAFLWRLSEKVSGLGDRISEVEARLGERIGRCEERIARVEGLLEGMARPPAPAPPPSPPAPA